MRAAASLCSTSFYKHLANREAKSEALRLAKLDYIAIAEGLAAHPAYWSPFILIGDERPVHIQRKGSNTLLWWLLAGTTLFCLVFFLNRARHKQAA